MNKTPLLIQILIGINAVVFFASLLIAPLGDTLMNHFALHFPKNDGFQIWQLASHMFLHGGPAHLLFNMFALWSFGTPLVQIWGERRFLLFYFTAGIGAGVIYTAVNYLEFNSAYQLLLEAGFTPDSMRVLLETLRADPDLVAQVPRKTIETLVGIYQSSAVGASGAIYGVLVVFGFLFPNAKLALIFLPIPIAAKFFIPAIVLLDLFSGITGFSIFGGGIAHFAHVGGALIGLLFMLYWRNKTRPPRKVEVFPS